MIDEHTDMPLDGTIEIIVQDGKNSSVSADITVIPPAPEIDEIYTNLPERKLKQIEKRDKT